MFEVAVVVGIQLMKLEDNDTTMENVLGPDCFASYCRLLSF